MMANMSTEKLQELLEREEIRLDNYKKKRTELDEKIRATEAAIQKYRVMLNNNQYLGFVSLVQEKGISLNEIMTAIQQGDLLSLQERIEELQEEEK